MKILPYFYFPIIALLLDMLLKLSAIFCLLISIPSYALVCNQQKKCGTLSEMSDYKVLCNTQGICWHRNTLKKMSDKICNNTHYGQGQFNKYLAGLKNKNGYDLKRDFEFINCSNNRTRPVNLNRAIMLRDQDSRILSRVLCYSTRQQIKKDYKWMKEDMLKKRPAMNKYEVTFKYYLNPPRIPTGAVNLNRDKCKSWELIKGQVANEDPEVSRDI